MRKFYGILAVAALTAATCASGLPTAEAAAAKAATATPAVTSTAKTTTAKTTSTAMAPKDKIIDESAAQAAALKGVKGAKESDVKSCSLDKAKKHYTVKIEYNKKAYKVKVDAVSGKVLKTTKEKAAC